MKIKRSVLEKMIREEMASHLKEMFALAEADDDKGANVVDADKEKKAADKKADKKAKDSKSEPKSKDKTAPADKPAELPVADEPEADAELEKDVADGEEDADEITGGKIADQVTGKTIQSITMDPKSKTLPGAMELVITFREIPDPLKVLVTKTGDVKFFFRGIHNQI